MKRQYRKTRQHKKAFTLAELAKKDALLEQGGSSDDRLSFNLDDRISVGIEELFPCNCYRVKSQFGGHSRYCQSKVVKPLHAVMSRIIREVIEDIREGLEGGK